MLDVQGAELHVLRGAKEILAQTHFLISEINIMKVYEGQCSFSDILHFVQDNGFEFSGFIEQFSTEDGKAVYVDALFSRKKGNELI